MLKVLKVLRYVFYLVTLFVLACVVGNFARHILVSKSIFVLGDDWLVVIHITALIVAVCIITAIIFRKNEQRFFKSIFYVFCSCWNSDGASWFIAAYFITLPTIFLLFK